MNELVTIVIITYKRPLEIIKRAVSSVLSQTYTKFEVILVNDAPEDISLSKDINEYVIGLQDSRVRYIEHKKNMGANAARNTGLRNANGKYICFLDDDDEFIEHKLELQVPMINDNVGLVYGPFYVRKNGQDTITKIVRPDNPLKAILQGNFIGSTSFPLLLTEAVRKVGGFDEKLISCQEYDLWIRIIKQYKIRCCKAPLGIYYISKDSTFKNSEKYSLGIECIINKYASLYSQYRRVLSNRYVNMSFTMLKKCELKRALFYRIKAIKSDISNPNNILLLYIINKLYKRIHV